MLHSIACSILAATLYSSSLSHGAICPAEGPEPESERPSTPLPKVGTHVQEFIRHKGVPVRGVNLGGWLVAEQWMTYDEDIWQGVSSDITSKGEYATMEALGHRGDSVFEKHRDTWITEDDIKEIASYGLNTVRVSVGFWIANANVTKVDDRQFVYAPGGLKYLDRLINEWASTHNVSVMLSFHGHMGSQNGRDHSGAYQCGTKLWDTDPRFYQNSIEVATFLAQNYKNSPAFLGLNLMNEPEYNTNKEKVLQYYTEAHQKIRDTGNDCILALSPMLTEQHSGDSRMNHFMDTVMQNDSNVWFEWHPYSAFDGSPRTNAQILGEIGGQGDNIKNWNNQHHTAKLFLGEWSMAVTAPANFETQQQQLSSSQLTSFRNANAGFTFWSWKHSDDDPKKMKETGWSLRQKLRQHDIVGYADI